ncbi:hypothetical protein [Peribacillus frigoritolerans]|uniref:hypothetical protein n=1 Tax=Peribacillus frigoritolerans TaxID=450367 RepID=UPI002EB86DD8|nr:hypothetical protein [Peribacillus frigoritolerans]
MDTKSLIIDNATILFQQKGYKGEKTEVTKIKKQITIQTGDLFLLFLDLTK